MVVGLAFLLNPLGMKRNFFLLDERKYQVLLYVDLRDISICLSALVCKLTLSLHWKK